jgi:hypothetical protein
MTSYPQQTQQQNTKCKYCNIQGLEWFKNTEGQNRLRYVSDKQPHTREECDNIKNRVAGFSFAEVLQKHKGQSTQISDSVVHKDYDQQTQQPQPHEGITALDRVVLADILRGIGDLRDKLNSIESSINGIKELMWQIPEIKEYVQANVAKSFVSAKQQLENNNSSNQKDWNKDDPKGFIDPDERKKVDQILKPDT